jgi:hypothetical protein
MNGRNFWILETREESAYRWVQTWESDVPLPFRMVRKKAIERYGEFDDDTRLRPATSDEAKLIHSWTHSKPNPDYDPMDDPRR